MDVLINIIITVAIVMFILRRMSEVAQKGKDITRPPVQRPLSDDEPDESPSRRFETPENSQPSRRFEVPEEPPKPRRFEAPAETPAPRRRGTVRAPVLRSYRLRMPHPAGLPIDEHDFETMGEEEAHLREREGKLQTKGAQSRAKGMRGTKETGAFIEPCFSRFGLIRGVIMREILGPPIGLKPRE
jgi:hypothetical protein